MSTMNIWIVMLLTTGIVLLYLAARMDRRSSFDDGTFLYQMILGVVGMGLVSGSLLWKLIALMFV